VTLALASQVFDGHSGSARLVEEILITSRSCSRRAILMIRSIPARGRTLFDRATFGGRGPKWSAKWLPLDFESLPVEMVRCGLGYVIGMIDYNYLAHVRHRQSNFGGRLCESPHSLSTWARDGYCWEPLPTLRFVARRRWLRGGTRIGIFLAAGQNP